MSERRLVFLICLWALFSCASGFGWIQPSSFRRESPISKDSSIPRSSISSWLEVRLSRLFGACQPVDWRGRLSQQVLAPKAEDPLDARTKTNVKPEDLFKDSLLVDDIPPYVLEYAPLVHLYSKEKFWPCDMAEHLFHITPNLNYTPIQSQSRILNLSNLDKLNIWDGGRFVYLTSNDNVEERPEWLGGQKNIPGIPKKQFIPEKGQDNIGNEDSSTHLSNDDENTASSDVNFQFSSQPSSERVTRPKRQKGTPERADARYLSRNQDAKKRRGRSRAHVAQKDMKRQEGGRSDAPAVLIVVDKGNGVVDAFWFFFYSYNLGNLVFNIRFGNHVGDWEHTMVRFQHGKPKYVYYSEHNFGSAYSYGAVEKIGKRVSQVINCKRLYSAITDVKACGLFCRWHTCDVRHSRISTICSSLWSSSRPNRPWAALGSCPEFSYIHLQSFIG